MAKKGKKSPKAKTGPPQVELDEILSSKNANNFTGVAVKFALFGVVLAISISMFNQFHELWSESAQSDGSMKTVADVFARAKRSGCEDRESSEKCAGDKGDNC